MDFDDIKPKPTPGPALGEDLTTLSVAELENRIRALEAEILRVKGELEAKRARQHAADKLFKS